MRALWKGSISFGLVNIPIRMYTATQEHELKFVLLHKKDHSQIRYARICKEEGKEVAWQEIVKGYEFQPGEFVVIDEEDFKKANLQKTKTIEIVNFSKEDEIDTIYYSKPYFLEPEKGAHNSYALLRDALKKSKKVGIAKFVIHNREHIAVIKPYENIIVLNELRYQSEIIHASELAKALQKEKTKTSPKELDVALKLIDNLTSHFNPRRYKDTYVDEIKKIINQKAKGRKIHPKGEEPKPSKVQDIMSLLKASLDQHPKKTRKRASA